MRAGQAALAVLLAAAAGSPALSKVGTPGLAYFAGAYQRVGRDGARPANLIDDVVILGLSEGRLSRTGCPGRDMWLVHDPSFDYANRLIGRADGIPLDCQFHTAGGERPILTCAAGDGGLFTLWPLSKDDPAALRGCG